MLKEFRKTLAKVIHLRSIIGYNGLVFSLKKMPLIGKLLPDRLYSTKALKIIYWIFHVIKEVFMLFIGKIFGLGMIYLVALLLKTGLIEYDLSAGIPENVIYGSFCLFYFIIYALCGILVNTNIFKCTTEKEYLVFMLRMNARKLNNTMLIYDLGKLVVGYLIAGIIALIAGAPFWVWLGIPVLAVFIKLFGAGCQAMSFRAKHMRNKPMRGSNAGYVFRIIVAMFFLPAAFIIAVNGYIVPLQFVFAAAAVLVLLGIWGFSVLNKFDSNLHRRALRDNIVREEVERHKNPDNTKQFKKLKAAGTVKEDKKGFEYLNALFVRRHRTMLVLKAVVFTALLLVLIGLIIFGFIYSYYKSYGADVTGQMVFSNLINLILFKGFKDPMNAVGTGPEVEFLGYLSRNHLLGMIVPLSIADISFKATQAMYINCDNSLMTFSFFKQRDKIIKLFDIRLKQLIKINVFPAIVCGLLANLFLFYSGGQDYPFQYLVTILVPVLMSVINSMTWLALYYLFQPFTTTVNIKSGAYMAIRIILSVIAVHIFWIPSNSLILAGILVVFTLLYVFFLRKIVYKKSPKTWKVKA